MGGGSVQSVNNGSFRVNRRLETDCNQRLTNFLTDQFFFFKPVGKTHQLRDRRPVCLVQREGCPAGGVLRGAGLFVAEIRMAHPLHLSLAHTLYRPIHYTGHSR